MRQKLLKGGTVTAALRRGRLRLLDHVAERSDFDGARVLGVAAVALDGAGLEVDVDVFHLILSLG